MAPSFQASARIKKSAEFARIQKSGTKLHSKHFLIILAKSDFPGSRLGITITRKVDLRATARNRLKRWIREVFRLNRGRIKGAFDILVIARQNASQCKYRDIKREILGAFYHRGYLQAKPKE